MRRHRHKGADQADIDMTPMLDIVFILLIFFIVTATFLSEKAIDLQQPPPSPTPPQVSSVPAITIYVDGKEDVQWRGAELNVTGSSWWLSAFLRKSPARILF